MVSVEMTGGRPAVEFRPDVGSRVLALNLDHEFARSHIAGPDMSLDELISWLLSQLDLKSDACASQVGAPSAAKSRVARVGRAEDFLRASFDRPVSLAEAAEVPGMSVRTLTRGFRERYGISPMRLFLRDLRLDQARRVLLVADPAECCVTSTALRYGFTHLARFSGEYHRRFGEYPSETLRRQS